jgi:hypothetical protein
MPVQFGPTICDAKVSILVSTSGWAQPIGGRTVS